MTNQEPINTIIKRNSHTRNSLSVEIDGLRMTLDFRKGGTLTSPVSYKATSNGGIGAQGLYEEWTCQGEVTVSKSLYEYLIKMYRQGDSLAHRGATHKSYVAVDGGVESVHVFKHVLLKHKPSLIVNDFGDNTTLLNVHFGLNDLLSVE